MKKEHKFKYKNIVNNQIVDTDFDHPLANRRDKIIFMQMLAEDLGISENDYFDISDGHNNLFRVHLDNIYYNIFIEFTDGGGRDISKNESHKKVAIPFHQKSFDEALYNNERVVTISVYIPLDSEFNPITDTRYYLIIEQKEIYNSGVYKKHSKNSSSRWVQLEDMLKLNENDLYSMNNNNNVYIVARNNIKKFLQLFLKKEYDKLITDELNSLSYNDIIDTNSKKYSKYRSLFREYMIIERGIGCEISSCDVRIPELLIASHIKPVNKILKEKLNNQEKVNQIIDVNNGFLFCRNHDGLFDKFLISFNQLGELFVSKRIKNDIAVLNIKEGDKYIDVKNDKMKKYLEYHFNIFNKKVNHLETITS